MSIDLRRKMSEMNLTQHTSLIAIIAIVSIGITSGTVIATQTFSQDVIIEAGGGENGNLIIQDGKLGIGATPNTNQVLWAKGKDGIPASFSVDGVNAPAIFSLRATGGTPVLQFVDDDTSPKRNYQIVLQGDESFVVRDATSSPPDILMKFSPNGDICIGAC